MEEKIVELIKLAKECGYNLDYVVSIDSNIIIPATSEEEHYYVLFDSIWYDINFDTNEFSQNDFGGEYYEDYYLNEQLQNQALLKYQNLLYEFDEVPSDEKYKLAMKAKEDYELIKK